MGLGGEGENSSLHPPFKKGGAPALLHTPPGYGPDWGCTNGNFLENVFLDPPPRSST